MGPSVLVSFLCIWCLSGHPAPGGPNYSRISSCCISWHASRPGFCVHLDALLPLDMPQATVSLCLLVFCTEYFQGLFSLCMLIFIPDIFSSYKVTPCVV